jgi:ABC-type sulfate transport system substrate-binding protein
MPFHHIKVSVPNCKASWILGTLLILIVALYGGHTLLVRANAPVHLVVYAFSTQEEIFTQGILPIFEQMWEAETGRDLTIESMFGPSATLAGQINMGAPADVALFSNAQHVNWLKIGRRVQRHTKPVVIGCTPMVIVIQPAYPAGITCFADLARPGLRLLHADPRRSGAGEWAVLAEYGSALLESGAQTTAATQLRAIWRNVRLLAPSARAALTLFELGAGDALITYEQDARLAMERGVELGIAVPPRTIIACHTAVIVDDNVKSSERPAAEAFIRFLLSDSGQRILRRYHLRPADLVGDTFPELVQPFTVDELGGWSRAYSTVVDGLWEGEIAHQLELGPAFNLVGAGDF